MHALQKFLQIGDSIVAASWQNRAARELKAYLRRRLDALINPLVYTFWDNQGTPSIMTMWAALAE
jgi:hypothetical protein